MHETQPSCSGPTWVGRFGACLMEMQPSISFISAVQHAVATWPYAAHLEPETAAEILRARMRANAGSRQALPDAPPRMRTH